MNSSALPLPRLSCAFTLLLLLVLALGPSGALRAQTEPGGVVSGRIVDANTQAALFGVEVSVNGTDVRARTDRDGEFTLRRLPGGTVTLTARYLGYAEKTQSVTVRDGQATQISFVLGEEVLTLPEFRVEGMIEGQARALNVQRAAQNISNIIASDSFGQFPDKSIADATRRLPGITIERGQGQGEGRYVTIRGMNADFNGVDLNGVRVSVSNFDGASRSVPLDVVSAKSAEIIEVSKAMRPDQDGDSIGGSISIRTRSPFDRDGRSVTAEAAIVQSSLAKDYGSGFYLDDRGYEVSASFSDILNEKKTWALALTANTRQNPYVSQSVDTRGFTTVSGGTATNNGSQYNGAFVPTGLLLQEFFDEIEQTGLTAAVEYRPDEATQVRVNATYTQRDSRRGRQLQDTRYDAGFGFWDRTRPIGVSGNTITRFTSENRLFRQVRDFYETQDLYSVALDGKAVRGPNTFTWLAGFNRGAFDGDRQKDLWLTFRTGFSFNEYNLGANGGTYFPGFSTQRDRNSPREFRLDTVDLGTRFITDDEFALRGDWQRDVALLGGNGFWKTGVQARWRSRDLESVDRFYDSFTNVKSLRSGSTALAWFLDENKASQGVAAVNYGPGASVDGRYNYGFFIDPAIARRVINSFLASGDLAFNADGILDSRNRSLAGSYQADEDVYSAYLMGQTTVGKWTWLAGIRAEATRVAFSTHQGVSQNSIYVNALPISRSSDYVDVLPGVHVRYDATKDIVVRAAATATLARPSYRQLNPSAVINNTDLTFTQGDTGLDPTTSRNLDLMVDYYLGGLGVVSGGLFYKDMSDNVYRLRRTALGSTIPGSNQPTANYQVSEFKNASGAEVYGFEAGIERNLRFLPSPFDGVGVFANYTWTESEVETGLAERSALETPLFGQVGRSYNLGLTYQKYGLQMRLAYNWRDSYLDFDGINQNPAFDRYLSDLGVLDLTASYALPKGFTVFVEFRNLTDEPDRAFFGTEDLRPAYNEYRDWSATFGVRWKL
jgi:TonB-dependent receptor